MPPLLLDELLAGLPAEECERVYRSVRYRWPLWARPKQLAPTGDWDIWGLCAGRGAGKTRPGSEWTVDVARRNPGGRMALMGRTARDTRDVMVLGESGILAVSPPWFRPRYYPAKSLVKWPNKFEAHLFSAEEPDISRGHQHGWAWGDEFAAWRKKESFTNLQDGLRLGTKPQLLLTTTPRRTPLFLDTFLGARVEEGRRRPVPPDSIRGKDQWEFTIRNKDHTGVEVTLRTVIRRWRTEENAINLAPGFAARRRASYAGSSYGRMEMDAEVLDLVEGALFNLDLINELRVQVMPPHHRRIVVVDPSHADDGDHDPAGIIVLGIGPSPDGSDKEIHGYVIDDCSVMGSPRAWGLAAIKAFDHYRCDAIVYEDNESPRKPHVVRDVLKSVDPRGRVPWLAVHAARDKHTRADPVAALYEAKRVHHYSPVMEADSEAHRDDRLAQLEHEMVSWDPWDPSAKSPNHLDALVHGLTYLMLQGHQWASFSAQGTGQRISPWGVSSVDDDDE